MKEILEKISSYQIFNYLFPGVVFAAIAEKLTSYKFIQDDIITGLFIYYFIGLVISRVGSLILEPTFRRAGFVQYVPYEDYIKASEVDKKIDTISETNNTYRTLLSTFICLVFIIFLEKLFLFLTIPNSVLLFALPFFLLLLFAYSWRKQTKYVYSRVRARTKQASNNEQSG